MMLANLAESNALETPTPILLQYGTTNSGGTQTFFISFVPQVDIESNSGTYQGLGTIIPFSIGTWGGTNGTWGTLGTWAQNNEMVFSFNYNTNASRYLIFCGTANGTNGTYMYNETNGYIDYGMGSVINGTYTIGIYSDAIHTFSSILNTTLGTTFTAYTNAEILPPASVYSVKYINNIITNEFANKDILIYDKMTKPVITLSYSQITDGERTDLETCYNWRAPMRFFPNIDSNPANYYDIYWANDFEFTFTTPTYTEGGYNGNVQLNSIYGNLNSKKVY